MALLEITGGAVLVDDIDLPLLQQYKWHVNDAGYAVWRGVINGRKQTVRMHRLINRTPKGMFTDHKNNNRLDNRRINLRTVTYKENANNRKGDKGYTWDSSKHKWMVRYKNQFYGRYTTEAEAKEAYKLASSGVSYTKSRRKLYYLPKGVSRLKGSKNFTAKAQVKGIRHYLGTFKNAEEAKKAYNNIKQGISQ